MSYPQRLSCAEMQLRTDRAFNKDNVLSSAPRCFVSSLLPPASVEQSAASMTSWVVAPANTAPTESWNPRQKPHNRWSAEKRERKRAEHLQHMQNRRLLAEYDQHRVQLAPAAKDAPVASQTMLDPHAPEFVATAALPHSPPEPPPANEQTEAAPQLATSESMVELLQQILILLQQLVAIAHKSEVVRCKSV